MIFFCVFNVQKSRFLYLLLSIFAFGIKFNSGFLSMRTAFMISFFFVFTSVFAQDYDVSVYLGPGDDAKYKGVMQYPFHLAFDSKDNMFIVEYKGSYLSVLDNKGKFRRLGGDGTWNFKVEDGPIKDAQFKGLHNIIIDTDDKVYFTDTFNNRCRVYDHEKGHIKTYIGSGKKGFNGDKKAALEASFNELYSVAFNKDKTKVYIADLKNQRVRVMDRKTGLVTTIAGNGKKGIPKNGANALESPMVDPRALAVDSQENVYVAERGGHCLRLIKDGKIYTLVNKKGKKGRKLGSGPEAQLAGPKYVGIDSNDKVWIADDENDRICLYDPETKQLTSVIGKDSKLSKWVTKRPHGLGFHKDGSIFVFDSGNNRLLKLVKK